jgi:hypothetical protein
LFFCVAKKQKLGEAFISGYATPSLLALRSKPPAFLASLAELHTEGSKARSKNACEASRDASEAIRCFCFFATLASPPAKRSKQAEGDKTKQGMQLLASYRATLHRRLACMPAEGGKPEAKRSKHAALPACIYRLRLAKQAQRSSVARLRLRLFFAEQKMRSKAYLGYA